MNINQVLQNSTVKELPVNGEVPNELDAKLAKLLQNDPESFQKLMVALEEQGGQEMTEASLVESMKGKENLNLLNNTKNNSLKDLSQTESNKLISDEVSTHKSGLKVFVKDPKNSNKTILLEELKVEKPETSKKVVEGNLEQEVSDILNRKLEQPNFERSNLDSNLSPDDISNIEKLLKSKEAAPQVKVENTEVLKNIQKQDLLKNDKSIFNNQLQKSEAVVKNPLAQESSNSLLANSNEDFVKLRNGNLGKGTQAILPKDVKKQLVQDNTSIIRTKNISAVGKATVGKVEADVNVNTLSTQELAVENNAPLAMVNPKTAAIAEASNSRQTFSIEGMDTSDREAVINKITNYVIQSNVRNNPKLEMSFSHSELGKIDLLVERAIGREVNVTIMPTSEQGMKFFAEHQSSIVGSLTKSGVALGEFKLDGQSLDSNLSDGSNSQEFAQNQGKSGQRREDSRKRQELWEHYQNKEAA